jgi:hypothetical protein
MLQKGFLKPEISIDTIGKRQFWIGTAMGVYVSIALSLVFGMSREAFRLTTIFNDLLILEPNEFRYHDLFFAALSVSLGFSATTIYWLIGRKKSIKKKYIQLLTVTNSAFISLSSFSIIARFGSNLAITPFSYCGFDNHFNFIRDFKYLLILIPVYIFLSNWLTIRLLFKVKKWMLLSIVACLVVFLFNFTFVTADKSVLNNAYYKLHEEKIHFIDQEILNARKFDISINDSMRQILMKNCAERTMKLLTNLKEDFSLDQKVSLEHLILEKILIHNRNYYQGFSPNYQNKDMNWPYAFPEDIYVQISISSPGSPEIQLLFEILAEQISIFNVREIDFSNLELFTREQKKKYYFKEQILRSTETVQSRLIQVVEKLKSEEKYKDFHHLLEDFEFDDYNGSQYFLEINLD